MNNHTYDLFAHMLNEHGLTLTMSELFEIIRICKNHPFNGMISIEDEYPEIDQYCVFYSKGGLVAVDHLDKDCDFDAYFHSHMVTYWIPEPEES